MNQEKFIEIRNNLILEVVEEIGEERAYQYFQVPSNREAIDEIAGYKTRIAPARDLSIENIRKKKWAHDA